MEKEKIIDDEDITKLVGFFSNIGFALFIAGVTVMVNVLPSLKKIEIGFCIMILGFIIMFITMLASVFWHIRKNNKNKRKKD